MNSWIFQGNPFKFDIDTYVKENEEIVWSVRQKHLADNMNIGDEVFLWRSKGNEDSPAGIIAVCTIISTPSIRDEDENALKYWRKDKPESAALRVSLRIDRKFANEKELIERELIQKDSILNSLRILKMANETNYILRPEEAERLQQICLLPANPRTYRDFGEAPDDNIEELQQFARRVRRGQPKFRQKLIDLYEGKCAISGWHPESVLAAAHIAPHCKAGINHSDNGILLRSDFHELFDDGLIQIDPETYIIRVDESLKNTPYWNTNGMVLRPRKDGSQPSKKYLLMKIEHDR